MAFDPLSRDHPAFPTRATGLVHAVASRVLAEVVAAAGAGGIAVLPVKGIVTAYSLHGRPDDRPIADVDVRVRREDLPAFSRVARERGWSLLERSRAYASAVYEISGLMLDVETSVGPPGLCGLRVADMIARAHRVVRPDGVEALEPELHDHALLLAVNAFKDKMTRAAAWSLDDVERIMALPELDLQRLADLARASSSATLLWLVADWMAGRLERRDDGVRWRALRALLDPMMRRRYARVYIGLTERAAEMPLVLPVAARLAADNRTMRWEALARAVMWQIARGWPKRAQSAP